MNITPKLKVTRLGGVNITNSALKKCQENQFALVEKHIDGDKNSIHKVNIRYQYGNQVESACLELNDEGDIITYEEYHPFGTSAIRMGSTQSEVDTKRYRYNGKERDEETGLYYYGARYYAAWLGRFLRVDPEWIGSANMTSYHYVSNNPVNRVDPFGMSDEEDEYEQHEVQEGETLSEIANQYDVSLEKLRELNPQTQERELEDQINVSEVLKIEGEVNEELEIDSILYLDPEEFEVTKDQVKRLAQKDMNLFDPFAVKGFNSPLEGSEYYRNLNKNITLESNVPVNLNQDVEGYEVNIGIFSIGTESYEFTTVGEVMTSEGESYEMPLNYDIQTYKLGLIGFERRSRQIDLNNQNIRNEEQFGITINPKVKLGNREISLPIKGAIRSDWSENQHYQNPNNEQKLKQRRP